MTFTRLFLALAAALGAMANAAGQSSPSLDGHDAYLLAGEDAGSRFIVVRKRQLLSGLDSIVGGLLGGDETPEGPQAPVATVTKTSAVAPARSTPATPSFSTAQPATSVSPSTRKPSAVPPTVVRLDTVTFASSAVGPALASNAPGSTAVAVVTPPPVLVTASASSSNPATSTSFSTTVVFAGSAPQSVPALAVQGAASRSDGHRWTVSLVSITLLFVAHL